MSAEHNLLSKLHSIYSSENSPTPVQIEKYISRTETMLDIKDKLGVDISADVLQIIVPQNGIVRHDLLKRFSASIPWIVERYGPAALLIIDQKCLHENGSVNGQKFRKKLKRR